MPRSSAIRLAVLGATAALAAGGCADPDARPSGTPAMLARVPAGASFALAVDLAELRDDPLADALGDLVPAGDAEEAFAVLRERTGIDLDEDLDLLLACGAPADGAPAWYLAEAWGRFDREAIEGALREEGVEERQIDGRPAFALAGEDVDPEAPALWLVLDAEGRLLLGSEDGLVRAGPQDDGGFGRILEGDPLLEALDPEAQVFAVYVDPEIDAGRMQEEVPMLGGMLGSLMGGVEGVAAGVRFEDGLSVDARLVSGREQDARALASILRGGVDFVQVALRQRGEPELASILDAVVLEHEGAVMRLGAELSRDQVLRAAAALVEAEGPGGP